MSFDLDKFKYILNTIDNLLSMSDPLSLVNISTGYGETTKNREEIFMELSFYLKNGMVKIIVYSSTGFLSYIDKNGEILKDIEFSDHYVCETNSAFNTALKQIRDFDRQYR